MEQWEKLYEKIIQSKIMINKSYSSLSDQEAISGASSAFRGWNFLSIILGAFNFVVGIAALPLRLILRKNIGERSIQPISFVLAITLHVYYFTLFDTQLVAVSILGTADNSFLNEMGLEIILYVGGLILINPYSLFLLWVIYRGVKHFRQKIRSALSEEVSYTYHRGESRYFQKWDKPTIFGFDVNDETIRMLAEPKAVLVIGLAISLASAVITGGLIFFFEIESIFLIATFASLTASGLVIAFDAFCLGIDEITLALNRRSKILDILDSEEDARVIVEQKDTLKSKRIQKGILDNPKESTEDDDMVIS